MAESLEYPDFSIVALFRKLVIGCALMTPEGYLSYIFVHPDWSGSSVGTTLLSLIIENAPSNRDVTLHVSATSPAVILYNKFGFKSEEFIVDFYKKYSVPDSYFAQISKSYNALYMRLRRRSFSATHLDDKCSNNK